LKKKPKFHRFLRKMGLEFLDQKIRSFAFAICVKHRADLYGSRFYSGHSNLLWPHHIGARRTRNALQHRSDSDGDSRRKESGMMGTQEQSQQDEVITALTEMWDLLLPHIERPDKGQFAVWYVLSDFDSALVMRALTRTARKRARMDRPMTQDHAIRRASSVLIDARREAQRVAA
jgi:hypothetical protein